VASGDRLTEALVKRITFTRWWQYPLAGAGLGFALAADEHGKRQRRRLDLPSPVDLVHRRSSFGFTHGVGMTRAT
jgi:hypothetical protein